MRSPSRNVVGRNTRTPLFSSCVTLDDGASSDDMTHVGTSRAVLTSCTPRLSIARRSNTTRTGGRRGVTTPRTVRSGLARSAVVRARLEVHHQGGAARTRARGLERDDLRMRSAVLGVVTLGHYPVSREHDGADQGIRSNAPPTPACEVEGAFHGRPLGGRSLRIRSECRYLRRHVPPWDRSPGTA